MNVSFEFPIFSSQFSSFGLCEHSKYELSVSFAECERTVNFSVNFFLCSWQKKPIGKRVKECRRTETRRIWRPRKFSFLLIFHIFYTFPASACKTWNALEKQKMIVSSHQNVFSFECNFSESWSISEIAKFGKLKLIIWTFKLIKHHFHEMSPMMAKTSTCFARGSQMVGNLVSENCPQVLKYPATFWFIIIVQEKWRTPQKYSKRALCSNVICRVTLTKWKAVWGNFRKGVQPKNGKNFSHRESNFGWKFRTLKAIRWSPCPLRKIQQSSE